MVFEGMWRRPGRRGAGGAAGAECKCSSTNSAESPGGEEESFSGEGEERHLPVHGGRAEPLGAVRQQAGTGQMGRQAAAGGAFEGISGGIHQPQLEAARAKIQVRQVWDVWGGAVGAAAAHSDRRR